MDLSEVLGAGAAGTALLVLVWAYRSRRTVVRRVHAVVARLDERPVGVEATGGNFESALARLERTTDRVNTRLSEARSATDRLSAALDVLGLGVVVVDERGRVVTRNAVAVQFWGARHGDALAEDAIRNLLGEAMRGVTAERELQLFGPPRRTLLIRALPLAEAGGAAGAVAVIEDVSSLRLVDSVRRDFVANVSHELKSPIGAVIALSETLEDDDDPEVMRRLARRVHAEADRLGRIVDDLLDLSLIEAQQAPDRAPVLVREVVSEAMVRVSEAADQARVALQEDEIGDGLAVVGDRRQLVSAVFNLLDNAVKYSPPTGEGRAPVVRVAAQESGERVVIEVADEGIGIPERDRDRIFERFYRVDRARSRASGGTGLGLAIVRHVAQAHGGTVAVQSEEGVGSTFTLSFPTLRTSPRRPSHDAGEVLA